MIQAALILKFLPPESSISENNTAPKRLGSFKRSFFPLVNTSSK
jgi:hypothetical protein